MKIVLDRMPALDAHESRQLVLAVRTLNVGGRESHRHFVGMLRSLLIYRINQCQRPMSVLALEFFGLNPDRKELGSQVSRFGLGKIEVALVSGRWIRHVEVVIEQALRRVGMSVNY